MQQWKSFVAAPSLTQPECLSAAARDPSPPPARPLAPRPRRPKFPETPAAACPTEPAEQLPVVAASCATLTRAGKPERGMCPARILWQGLLSRPPARCGRSVQYTRHSQIWDEFPLQTTSPITYFSLYFILDWGRGGGGGRPHLMDRPRECFADFHRLLGVGGRAASQGLLLETWRCSLREEAPGSRGFQLYSFPPPLISTRAFRSGQKW